MTDAWDCEYVLDGYDTDGTPWYRCTIHKELSLSDFFPCEGFSPPPYKEVAR